MLSDDGGHKQTRSDEKKKQLPITTSLNNLRQRQRIGDYSDFILAHKHMKATTAGGLKPN